MDVEELYRPAGDDAVVLNVHVEPGAGRSAVVGRHGSALEVRVTAPPVGGRANEGLCRAAGRDLRNASAADMVGGEHSRERRFRLSGIDLDAFRRCLERMVRAGTPGPGPGPRRQGRR